MELHTPPGKLPKHPQQCPAAGAVPSSTLFSALTALRTARRAADSMGAGLRPAAHNAAQQRAPPHDVESSAGGGAASPASSDSEKPPRRSDGTSRPRSLGLLAALLYGGTAVAMGFINKVRARDERLGERALACAAQRKQSE